MKNFPHRTKSKSIASVRENASLRATRKGSSKEKRPPFAERPQVREETPKRASTALGAARGDISPAVRSIKCALGKKSCFAPACDLAPP